MLVITCISQRLLVVWIGLNKVTTRCRHSQTVFTENVFKEWISYEGDDLVGDRDHPADWEYKYVTSIVSC